MPIHEPLLPMEHLLDTLGRSVTLIVHGVLVQGKVALAEELDHLVDKAIVDLPEYLYLKEATVGDQHGGWFCCLRADVQAVFIPKPSLGNNPELYIGSMTIDTEGYLDDDTEGH